MALRRVAYARLRGVRPLGGRRVRRGSGGCVAAAALFMLALLAIVGWAVVTFAVRLGEFAGEMFTVSGKQVMATLSRSSGCRTSG